MSKRSANGQGDKFHGLDGDDEDRYGKSEPMQRATTAQLAGRKIAAMKSRRTASPSKAAFGSPSANSFQAMGNPFANTTSDNNSSGQQPSSGFSFSASTPAFGANNTNATPMFGSNSTSTPMFGGNNNNTSSTPSFSFGASSQSPSTSSNIFGNLTGGSSGFNFGGGGGGNNPFASSQPAPQSTQSFSFGSAPTTFGASKSDTPAGAFGQTSGATGANATSDADMMVSPPGSPEKKGTGLNSAPTTSIFGTMAGGTSQPAANPFAAIKPGAPSEAPKFTFGQSSANTNGAPSTAAATPFKGFGTAASSNTDAAAPKPAEKPASLFGASTTAPAFSFGTAKASSPEEPAETNGKAEPSATNTSDTSATPFKGISTTSATANTSSTPFKGFGTTSISATPFKGFSTGASSQPAQAAAAPTNLFTQANSPTSQAPSQSAAGPAFNAFSTKSAQASPARASNATASQAPAYPSLAAATKPVPAFTNNSDATNLNNEQTLSYDKQIQFRALNAKLQRSLSRMEQKEDWTSMLQAYISQAASIVAGTTSSKRPREANDDSPANGTSKRVRADNNPASAPTASPSQSKTADLFKRILDREDEPSTPTKTTGMLFSGSTTPSGSPAKNLFTGFGAQPKPAESSAEETRPPNPFAALAKVPTPAPATNGFSASTAGPAKTPAVSTSAPSNLFQIKPAASEQPAPSPFQFKPVSAAPASAPAAASGPPAFQVPKFGGGAASSGSGTDFMAAFAAKAKKDTEKMMAEAKAKRKAEDFDSDEDDEAEWERKDAEQQAAKKAKLDEEAKKQAKFVPGQGFVFGDAAAAASKDASAAAPAFQIPKFGSGSTGPTNFLSAFSAKAKEDTEKMLAEAKAKRKAEDFDSEEDDEEEWERKDAEEQAAKKAKLEADAKKVAKFVPGKGFVFEDPSASSEATTSATAATPAASADKPAPATSVFASSTQATPAANNPFAKLAAKPANDSADNEDADDEAEAKATKTSATSAKSMFDRVTPADKPATSLFGSPVQDKTWKPDSPIKFGDAKPSVGFSFGVAAKPDGAAAAPAANLFGNLSKPASAMTSATTSRAGSPGTTDAEAGTDGNADDDAESSLPQTDLTALTADEKRTEAVLFEVERARCMNYNKANKESPWEVKGTGPLRVLKNKNTDVVRIVLRVAPTGKVVINTRLSAEIKYEFQGKGMVKFGIASKAGEVPEQWMIKVKEDDVAKKFAGICKDWQNH